MSRNDPKSENDYGDVISVECGIYDEREVHTNCTVEIWRNSVTGETSIGWWENDKPPLGGEPDAEAESLL